MPRSAKRSATILVCARYAWVLWTGTASALQSSDYGNVGPVGSWTMLNKAAEYEGCVAQRTTAMADFMRDHPQAVKRKEDVLFEKKALPGDEEMIVHTATSFLCLPENVDPATVKEKQLRGEPLSKP